MELWVRGIVRDEQPQLDGTDWFNKTSSQPTRFDLCRLNKRAGLAATALSAPAQELFAQKGNPRSEKIKSASLAPNVVVAFRHNATIRYVNLEEEGEGA